MAAPRRWRSSRWPRVRHTQCAWAISQCGRRRKSPGGVSLRWGPSGSRRPVSFFSRHFSVTDENRGGAKRPKATFGDAMLGIPSGGKDHDGPREKKDKKDHKGGGKGPVVVIKRASGAGETRAP